MVAISSLLVAPGGLPSPAAYNERRPLVHVDIRLQRQTSGDEASGACPHAVKWGFHLILRQMCTEEQFNNGTKQTPEAAPIQTKL
jgi:hypothetical protein